MIHPKGDHYAPEDLPLMTEEHFCRLVRIFGSSRVLFGTDSPWDDMKASVGRINALPLTDSEKDDILGGNARRLLDL